MRVTRLEESREFLRDRQVKVTSRTSLGSTGSPNYVGDSYGGREGTPLHMGPSFNELYTTGTRPHKEFQDSTLFSVE